MSYYFKLSASAAREFSERMRQQEADNTFIAPNGALREGCKIVFCDKKTSKILTVEIMKSSYGAKTGQHTFTLSNGQRIKGRNLYDRIIEHVQGATSIAESR